MNVRSLTTDYSQKQRPTSIMKERKFPYQLYLYVILLYQDLSLTSDVKKSSREAKTKH